jgi:hypothetical protein
MDFSRKAFAQRSFTGIAAASQKKPMSVTGF